MIVLVDEEVRLYVGCPCGVRAGQWCLTKQGNPRACHRVRVKNAHAYIERLIGT